VLSFGSPRLRLCPCILAALTSPPYWDKQRFGHGVSGGLVLLVDVAVDRKTRRGHPADQSERRSQEVTGPAVLW